MLFCESTRRRSCDSRLCFTRERRRERVAERGDGRGPHPRGKWGVGRRVRMREGEVNLREQQAQVGGREAGHHTEQSATGGGAREVDIHTAALSSPAEEGAEEERHHPS